jgi:NADPH:quinone reductase-like Zn-dependent oxidoreductase
MISGHMWPRPRAQQNIALVKSLGADLVVDHKNDDFEKLLQGYDVVLNSLGKDTLEKSLGVMKPGGKLISISGPPDPEPGETRLCPISDEATGRERRQWAQSGPRVTRHVRVRACWISRPQKR